VESVCRGSGDAREPVCAGSRAGCGEDWSRGLCEADEGAGEGEVLEEGFDEEDCAGNGVGDDELIFGGSKVLYNQECYGVF
jgi:hypothetical protein